VVDDGERKYYRFVDDEKGWPEEKVEVDVGIRKEPFEYCSATVPKKWMKGKKECKGYFFCPPKFEAFGR